MLATDRQPLSGTEMNRWFDNMMTIARTLEDAGPSGVLRFLGATGERVGDIVLSDSRVCLVAGSGRTPRLGELLTRVHPETAPVLQAALRQARRDGVPLGEVLLRLGHTPVEHLRDCLHAQIVAGLSEIASGADDPSKADWTPLAGRYDRRLTFSPIQTIVDAARSIDDRRDAATLAFDHYGELGAVAVLARRAAVARDGYVPVSVRGLELESLAELRDLSRSLSSLIRPAALISANIHPRVVVIGESRLSSVAIAADEHVAFFGALTAAERGRILSGLATLREVDGEACL